MTWRSSTASATNSRANFRSATVTRRRRRNENLKSSQRLCNRERRWELGSYEHRIELPLIVRFYPMDPKGPHSAWLEVVIHFLQAYCVSVRHRANEVHENHPRGNL